MTDLEPDRLSDRPARSREGPVARHPSGSPSGPGYLEAGDGPCRTGSIASPGPTRGASCPLLYAGTSGERQTPSSRLHENRLAHATPSNEGLERTTLVTGAPKGRSVAPRRPSERWQISPRATARAGEFPLLVGTSAARRPSTSVEGASFTRMWHYHITRHTAQYPAHRAWVRSVRPTGTAACPDSPATREMRKCHRCVASALRVCVESPRLPNPLRCPGQRHLQLSDESAGYAAARAVVCAPDQGSTPLGAQRVEHPRRAQPAEEPRGIAFAGCTT